MISILRSPKQTGALSFIDRYQDLPDANQKNGE
jgi:hypothetical protein